jgi:hypothetical protein
MCFPSNLLGVFKISWRSSSEIKDGLPLLCSSWTSVFPSENSQHHFVTFYRFITLPQTATICLWISTGRSILRWEIVDGMHLAFGGTLHRHCHFKQVLLKQSRFYNCQTSTAYRQRIKVHGNVTTISIKISLSAYTCCTFTFVHFLSYLAQFIL